MQLLRTITPLSSDTFEADGTIPVAGVDGGAVAAGGWTLGSLLYMTFSVAMVIGPVVGYIEQWRKMHLSRSSEGYSTSVSLILIVCNSLRIIYFVGEPFSVTLLWQSLVMLLVQFGLLITVLKIAMSHRLLSNSGGTTSASPPSGHHHHHHSGSASWASRWSPLHLTPRELLVRFTMVFALAAAIAGMSFHWYPSTAPSFVGYLALGVEATLVTPQLWLNLKRKSTEGLSPLLVATWCIGDVVKMIFFVVEKQPSPFVVCGSFQLMCDAVVLFQIWLYRSPLSKRGYGVTVTSGSPFSDPGSATVTMEEVTQMVDGDNATSTGVAGQNVKEWF